MPRQTRRRGIVVPLLLLLSGCRIAPDIAAQDARARELLTDLNHATTPASCQVVYAAASDTLRRDQTLPQFTETVTALNRRVGHLRAATRTDYRVTRNTSDEITSLVYHLSGDRGQADVKISLTHRHNQWLLDSLRTN